MNINTKLITLSIALSGVLYGANAPTINDVNRQVQPPKEVTEKKSVPIVEVGGVKKFTPSMKDDKSDKTTFVKSFIIDGAVHIKEGILQALIASYKDKDLTFSQLEKVASIITKEYRERGYFVARAYIPVQNMNGGVVKIAIIEGNYGQFRLNNNSLIKDSVVQGMLDDAKRDNIVSTHTLERAMLIINDTPGTYISQAEVFPGDEVGTSDFTIVAEASKKYDGYIVLDNYGGRYTGKNRVMAGLNVNSPFKLGDKLSLSGLVTKGTDLKNGRVSYSLPLMSNGLKGEISYSDTRYSLVEEYQALDAIGRSKTIDLKITYPVIRTRLENFNVSLYFASKTLKDEVRSVNDTTEKSVKVSSLEFDYNKNSVLLKKYNSKMIASVALTYGNLKFKDDVKRIADEAGANTNGKYSKILLSLGEQIAFTQKITFDGLLKYQRSFGNKNLDGSEDFSIGGSNGVRLYPYSELSAENGYLLNLEAKYKFDTLSNGLTNQVGLFYDRGRAYMADSSVVSFNDRSLEDVGLSYYLRYKDFFASAKVAWKIDDNQVTSEPDRNSKILVQGGWVF